MKNRKTAFTLLELSAVVIIIGLLAAGIMKGISMVQNARLSSARSLTTSSHINEISGLIAWYETSLLDSLNQSQTSDASQVSEWRDISAGSISAQRNKLTRTASSSVTYKMNGINNVPSIQFTSSGNFNLNSFYQGDLGQGTVFIVMRPTIAPSATATILFDSKLGNTTSSSIGSSNNKVYLDAGLSIGTATTTNVPSFVLNGNYILAAYFNGNNSEAYVNDAVTRAGGALIAPGTNLISGLTIGTNKTSGSAFTGLISEVIIFNRILSIDERKMVMSYLSKKYKIAVTGA
jgi:prepilin-type N-terminal cleavage/methylation domain-containing protein